MIADPSNCPKGLRVKDTDDFIWAFTFSSDSAGGEQTDYSLSSAYSVHHNVFKACSSGLSNNVMFGNDNYSNVIGSDCKYNSWGNNCNGNSWSNFCSNNSWGNSCQNNSWGNACYRNSWGNYCYDNSWGNSCQSNSWGNSCSSNSWDNQCTYNSWGNEITQSTVFDGVKYTQITTAKVKNIQVLNGLAGTSSSKVSLNFAANKSYTQVATKNSAGELKIYVPGDLA